MADQCQATWKPTEEQLDKIILPAMQGIAQQCASHINELQCPPEFIALMLRDIADTSKTHHRKVKVIVSAVDASSQSPALDILRYKYYK